MWRRRLKKGAKIPQRSSSRRGCILRSPLSEVTQKRRTQSRGMLPPVVCASVQFSGDSNNHWCTHLSLSSTVLYMQMQQKSIRNNTNCCCRRNRKRIAAFVKIAILFWRKRWDSNPRAREDYLISSQARYDHFDTLPYISNSFRSMILYSITPGRPVMPCCGARNPSLASRSQDFDRGHSLTSLIPLQAALGSLPTSIRFRDGPLYFSTRV